MDVPLEIGFHNLPPSDMLAARIRERVDRLHRVYDRIVACRVRVEAPHRQHRKGNLFTIRVDITVPGDILIIDAAPHRPTERYRTPDLYTIVNEVFEAAERQLRDFKEKRRDDARSGSTGAAAEPLPTEPALPAAPSEPGRQT